MTHSTDDDVARRIGLQPGLFDEIEIHVSQAVPPGTMFIASGREFFIANEDGAVLRRLHDSFRVMVVDIQAQIQPLLDAFEDAARAMGQYHDAIEVLGEHPLESSEPGIDAYSGPVSVDIDECWREDCDEPVSRDDDVGLCDSCKAELKEM